MFSQAQAREYFMGSVKLPFRTPATNTISMASQGCSTIRRSQYSQFTGDISSFLILKAKLVMIPCARIS
jgi:hypothetical protein